MDIIEIFLDALIDAVKMLPFLYAAFLLMEFAEHRAGDKLAAALGKAGHSPLGGTVAGAALGLIPQCGFSIAAANLYAGGVIGSGTLMAVFISTSDEALPVLIAHPDMAGAIWRLLAAKAVIAVITGSVFGILHKKLFKEDDSAHFDEICVDCGCGSHSIWFSSLMHTVKIFLFVLIVNLVLGFAFALAGQDNVMAFLDSLGFMQPFAAALVGLIPNCASSVIITELYANGGIPFGTAAGGLCAGAGMGLAVLFRSNKRLKENLFFLFSLYLSGALWGVLINAVTIR